MKYIDEHKDEFGVESICQVLAVAPSTYYAAKKRPPSPRSITDAAILEKIRRVHAVNNDGTYGAQKLWAQINRDGGVDGHRVARCTVERLMRAAGLHGVARRATGPRTTLPATGQDTRADLVERAFTADAPNRLWVADITYVRTFTGWVYAAFIIDVYSRYIVGWQVSRSLHTDLALDALNMAIFNRQHAGADLSGLIHHSDRGVQYCAVRYSTRLSEEAAVASVGSRGDSFDNAMAEAFNSLYKAELVRHKGPWKGLDDVELATAEYIDWFNHRRLHGEIGLIPPAELEAAHHAAHTERTTAPAPVGA